MNEDKIISVTGLEVLRGVSGECPAIPARGSEAVTDGIAGGLMIVLWLTHHKGFSASHWHPGTSVVDDARCFDCAELLLGVQIRISVSDRVRSPRMSGEGPMNLRGSYDQSHRYNLSPNSVSQKRTLLLHTNRIAVLRSTRFVAGSGLIAFDTAWLHWKSGRGLG